MRTRSARLALVAGVTLAVVALAAPAIATAPARATAPAPAIDVESPSRVFSGRFWYGIEMAVDSGGHIHLVASGFHDGKAGLWYGTDRTGAWAFHRALRWSAGAVWVRPSLAVDVNGRVHIAVEKAGCVECTIAPAKGIWYLSDVGRSRGTFPASPERLTPDGTAQPSLRVAGGHRFLAYAGNPDLAMKAVRLRTDASGVWTTTQVAAAGTEPSLRLGMNGKPRVAYRVSSGLRYAVASTFTGGWTKLVVPGTDADDLDPRLSFDELGGVHLAWVDASDPVLVVNHVGRSGGAWTFIQTVGEGSRFALSVDTPDRPWVAIGGDTVRAVVFLDDWWQTIAVSPDPAIEVAIKALDSGDVVMAWAGGAPAGLWMTRTD